jgi:hypothetical protein
MGIAIDVQTQPGEGEPARGHGGMKLGLQSLGSGAIDLVLRSAR